jgi:hypothetical protein
MIVTELYGKIYCQASKKTVIYYDDSISIVYAIEKQCFTVLRELSTFREARK